MTSVFAQSGPVIPDFGGGGSCVRENRTFCWGWFHDHWGDTFQPAVVSMEFRLPDLENPARQHGVTLGQVAGRNTTVEGLQKASIVMRAQAYRRRLFGEFERVKELLLP